MSIKLHKVPKEFNATPRRISILANYITHHLKSRQALCQAKGYHFMIRESDVIDALEGFTNPKTVTGI